MRKYVEENATVFELCWKPTERSKPRRTGRLENDLTNIGIGTREEIARLQSNNLIVFFVSYADDSARETYQSAHRQVSFSLPTSDHGQHIEVSKPRKVKRGRKLAKEPQMMTIYRLITDSFEIEHESKDLLLHVQERLERKKICCFIATSLVERPPNYQYKTYPPYLKTKKERDIPVSIYGPAGNGQVNPPSSDIPPTIPRRLMLSDILPAYLFSLSSYKKENWDEWENIVEKYLIGQDYDIIHWHTESNTRYVTTHKGLTRRSYGYGR